MSSIAKDSIATEDRSTGPEVGATKLNSATCASIGPSKFDILLKPCHLQCFASILQMTFESLLFLFLLILKDSLKTLSHFLDDAVIAGVDLTYSVVRNSSSTRRHDLSRS